MAFTSSLMSNRETPILCKNSNKMICTMRWKWAPLKGNNAWGTSHWQGLLRQICIPILLTCKPYFLQMLQPCRDLSTIDRISHAFPYLHELRPTSIPCRWPGNPLAWYFFQRCLSPFPGIVGLYQTPVLVAIVAWPIVILSSTQDLSRPPLLVTISSPVYSPN